jgi:hypothetical protein
MNNPRPREPALNERLSACVATYKEVLAAIRRIQARIDGAGTGTSDFGLALVAVDRAIEKFMDAVEPAEKVGPQIAAAGERAPGALVALLAAAPRDELAAVKTLVSRTEVLVDQALSIYRGAELFREATAWLRAADSN